MPPSETLSVRLDATLPHLPALGPLLRRLHVQSYRDLLVLDLQALARCQGVGRQKLSRLRLLREEALLLERREQPGSTVETQDKDNLSRFSADSPLLRLAPLSPHTRAYLERHQLNRIDTLIEHLALIQPEADSALAHLELKRQLKRLVNEGPQAFSLQLYGRPDLSRALALYGDQDPRELLGHLSPRATRIVRLHEFHTLHGLVSWLLSPQSLQTRNFGRSSHHTLLERIEQLGRLGPEHLIFRGPRPSTLNELFERYLDQPNLDREVFHARFVEGATLEQIGRKRGFTRERGRQILERSLIQDRGTWGLVAHELLMPALNLIRSQGGIAPTHQVMSLLAYPHQGAIALACQLSNIAFLRIDVIAGLSSLVSSRRSHALKRALLALRERSPDLSVEALCQKIVKPSSQDELTTQIQRFLAPY